MRARAVSSADDRETVGCGLAECQLDGATPQNDFRIADIDVPPACGAPFGRHIVAYPFISDKEYKWLSGRTAGIETRQSLRLLRFELFQIVSNDRLREKWKAFEMVQ